MADTELRTATLVPSADIDPDDVMPYSKKTAGTGLFGVKLSALKAWLLASAGSGLPAGGTAGQVLTKIDATDGNADWETPAAGGGGGGGGGSGGSGGLVKIAQVAVTAAQTTIHFDSIPQTYDDIVIVANIACSPGSGGDLVRCRINGDAAVHYSSDSTNRYGNTQGFAETSLRVGATGSFVGAGKPQGAIDGAFINYKNTSTAQIYMANALYASNGDLFPETYSGLQYAGGAPIAALDFFMNSGDTFQPGTVFTIYGRGGAIGAGGGAGSGGTSKAWLSAFGNSDAAGTATANATPGSAGDIQSAMGYLPGSWFFNYSGRNDYIIYFDFQVPVRLDGIMFVQQNNTNQGQFQVEVSTDGTTYTPIGDPGTWGGTNVSKILFPNTNPFRYYRLRQVGGAVSNGPYQFQFLFRWLL